MLRLFSVLLACLLLIFTPNVLSKATVSAEPKPNIFINLSTVQKVICMTLPKGWKITDDLSKMTPEQRDATQFTTGTATIIAQNRVLTAHHVIAGASACLVGGKAAKVSYDDAALDVTVLTVNLPNMPVTTIACDGFKPLAPYFAIGYAEGSDFALQQAVFMGMYGDVTAEDENGQNKHVLKHAAFFQAEVYPGMSGGPVIGMDGRIYGIINAGLGEHAVFRDLQDTPLCAALKPPALAADAPDTPIATAP